MLRWLKTVVVSDEEKAHRMRQVGTGKTTAVEAPKVLTDDIKTGMIARVPGVAWRVPAYWPGGVRCRGGVSRVCRSCMEREKACSDTAAFSRAATGSARLGREYRCGTGRRTGS